MATSTGVGEPKLMTWLTISPASNENRQSGSARCKAKSAGLFPQGIALVAFGDCTATWIDRFLRPAGK